MPRLDVMEALPILVPVPELIRSSEQSWFTDLSSPSYWAGTTQQAAARALVYSCREDGREGQRNLPPTTSPVFPALVLGEACPVSWVEEKQLKGSLSSSSLSHC